MNHIQGLWYVSLKKFVFKIVLNIQKISSQNQIISVNIYTYYAFISKDKFFQKFLSTLNC